jgi:hypothetical protein
MMTVTTIEHGRRSPRPSPEQIGASELRYADGARRAEPLTPDQQVALYARCLHEGQPGLVEVAAGQRKPDGCMRMRRRDDPGHYPAAGDQAALAALVRRHRAAGEEVFATPLTRREPRPGASAVDAGQVVWIDIDDPTSLDELRAFAHRPHLVVWSGSGGAHAYWRLADRVCAETIEDANRRLCHALGGDPSSTDRARLMRLPGTVNHKAGAWSRIAWLDLASPGVGVDSLIANLEDPTPPSGGRAALRSTPIHHDDELARVPPPEYFRALTGLDVPDRGGYVLCPVHDERTPSCRVWPDPDQGWHCFGCRHGGSVYDLASLLDGGPHGAALRGEDFKRVKQHVRERLRR